MFKKAYIVTDFGFGDSGKGGVIHKLSTLFKPHTVIKVGGAQGSHGVVTSTGQKFDFSQFGCGTLNGIKTYISDKFVVDPIGLVKEGLALRYECGINNPLDLITLSEDSLIATPYHGIISRLRELSRKDNPRGTVGVGVGEAFTDSLIPDFPSLYVRDLKSSDLRKKIKEIKQAKKTAFEKITSSGFLLEDEDKARDEINLFLSGDFEDELIRQYENVVELMKIVDGDFFQREILDKEGIIIFESSHGVLSDFNYGFYPHVSKIRTLPKFTSWKILEDHKYDGQIVNLGVTRGYQIRHGAGPLVTEDVSLLQSFDLEKGEETDRYRGEVRVGHLDLVMLKYAVEICGGPSVFDGLIVSCLDHVFKNGYLAVCDSYESENLSGYFSDEGKIIVNHGAGEDHLVRQEKLKDVLLDSKPVYLKQKLQEGGSKEELIEICKRMIGKKIGIPIRMVSFGSKEADRFCI